MFGRKLIPVWIGIVLLSAMFLMGQEAWPPQNDPCDPDPCKYIPRAVSDSCEAVEADDFTCNCDMGFAWQDALNMCEGLPPGPLAQIPAGCFDMGDHCGEGYCDELPVHNVCITAFEMDIHEVTNAEYAACVADGGCLAPPSSSSSTRETYYGDPAYSDFPVIYVDWDQAEDYCRWAGKRLPTEAEWEYAARGGLSGKRYPWGDTISGSHANYWNSGDPWDNDTSPVGYYAANGYGLYDMAGNVREWINDWYQCDYYSVSPTNDPPGPASGTSHVLRGGSWYYSSYPMRVADRSYDYPDNEFGGIGFRCARSYSYPTEGSVHGLVVPVSGGLINGAAVYLDYPGGSESTTTDAASSYAFENVPISGGLPPPPFVSPLPSGSPYLITVVAEGYTDTFTAVELDYVALEDIGEIEVVEGHIQVVSDLEVSAIVAGARRPIVHVMGKVIREDTSQPLENVIVSLGGGPSADPEEIWSRGRSTWDFPDNEVLTGTEGEFEFTNVPEHNFGYMFCYTVDYSKEDFIALDSDVEVWVGGPGPTYYLDADPGDSDPMTPLRMLPVP